MPRFSVQRSTINFAGDEVTWNGITSVQSGGAPVSGYAVISGSGINWGAPFGSCGGAGNGDGNGDGTADGLDVAGMTNILVGGGAPSGGQCAYDMNADGSVNLGDLPLFVAALLN